MNDSSEQEVLYTDIVLELLTAYLYDKGNGDKELSDVVMEGVRSHPVLNGKGLMEGLLFSSIIHLALMITVFAITTNQSREEVLKKYAMSYQLTRDTVSTMTQVHPEIVNALLEKLEGLI